MSSALLAIAAGAVGGILGATVYFVSIAMLMLTDERQEDLRERVIDLEEAIEEESE